MLTYTDDLVPIKGPVQPTPKPEKTVKRNRRRLWEDQKGLCAYCDKALDTPNHGTLDHIIPKSKGGGSKGNLALVCPPCNAFKGSIASLDEAKAIADRIVKFFENLKQRGYLS